MNDQTWTGIRYVLIAVSSFLAGSGYVSIEEGARLVDQIMAVAGGAVTVGTALWGLYVRWNTKAVPAPVAARPDVPTVSAATGEIQR